MVIKKLPETLSEALDEAYFEHDMGYEEFYGQAMKRVIEILKENDLDEPWDDNVVQKRLDIIDKEFQSKE